jgi:hypothetical protein
VKIGSDNILNKEVFRSGVPHPGIQYMSNCRRYLIVFF